MTLVKDIRKTVTDTTPVFAAVGATDLAVEKVRDARARAVAARADLDVSALQDKAMDKAAKLQGKAMDKATMLQDKAIKRAEKLAEQAQHIPALALNQTLEAAGKAQETYAELAVRGHKLVKRIRTQKSTQDLLAQADSTVSLGKGAVTTVRKAAVDAERVAKATLTTGRHEAGVVIDAVVSSVHREAKVTTGTVRKSAAVTRKAVKRTSTTAKKSTTSARRATKSAVTSATKTTAAAAAAAKVATPKVGD
jgi:heparin binding hemagglutinin HbhA